MTLFLWSSSDSPLKKRQQKQNVNTYKSSASSASMLVVLPLSGKSRTRLSLIAAIGCDYMWTCDSRSSVEWFLRSCDHLRSSAIICEPGLSSVRDIWCGPRPHQISHGRNLALIILILLLIKYFKNVYNLCDRGFLPGSVGGLQAPTNWILSIVTQAWSLVR